MSDLSQARLAPRVAEDLKWHRIIERIGELCATEVGRGRARLTPIWADVDMIRAELARVTEFKRLYEGEKRPPLGGIASIGEAIIRAGKGAALDGQGLLQVAESLRAGGQLRRWFDERRDQAPLSAEVASEIPDLGHLARMLFATFDSSGQIRDDATPQLADLRRRLTTAVQRAKRRMDDFIANPEFELTLQDDYYTLRDGRYVLPVKSSEKTHFSGIIHGRSNTAQTVYVEPEGMIALNNEIIVVRDDISSEEYAVLRDRTDRILAEVDEISALLDRVAELDHLAARAQLSLELHCNPPALNTKGYVNLMGARNPILALREIDVVANDVQVGSPWKILVVTGPNTGGKTVTLMTVGLATLMAQAGMHIPAGPDSHIAVFPRIFTLFGDPQSIEADLSTFSGHLTQVHEVLRQAGPGELVLMDEIIVGTEPSGGAALAIAVLEELATRGAVGVVTTHYDRLKTLSLTDDRFQNASVGLDRSTTEPNYVLTTGVPGSSSPIEVARRLGLPTRVVDRAVEALGRREQDLQAALERVDAIRGDLQRDREKLAESEARARDKERQLAEERDRVRAQADRLARQQKADVLADLSRAKEQVRQLVHRLQSSNDLRAVERGRRALEKLRNQVDRRVPEPSPEEIPEAKPEVSDMRAAEFSELREGMEVFIKTFGQMGVLRQTPDSPRKIEVAVGSLRTAVEIDALAIPNRKARRAQQAGANPPPAVAPSPAPAAKAAAAALARPAPTNDEDLPPQVKAFTIDLRGMRVHEALDEMTKELDQAVLAGKAALYVVHGHGTGALKRAVREALRQSRYVRRHRPGGHDEGGDGCTVVWLAD